jgi:hypothetical protein
MEVSDQPHAPAALASGIEFRFPIHEEAGGFQFFSEGFGKNNNLLSVWGSNHGSSVFQPTT